MSSPRIIPAYNPFGSVIPNSANIDAMPGIPRSAIPGDTENMTGNYTNDHVSGAYVVKKDTMGWDMQLSNGQLIFAKRECSMRRDKEGIFLSIFQMNYALAKEWENFKLYMKSVSSNGRGKGPGNDTSRNLSAVLSRPSAIWSHIFKNVGGTTVDAAITSIQHISQEGIKEKWNFLGLQLNAVENGGNKSGMGNSSYVTTPYVSITVVVKGVTEAINLWGDDANQHCELYLILKRKYNAVTDEYEEFGFFPWVTDGTKGSTAPMPSDTQYRDLMGRTQFGVVYYIGKVIDNPYGGRSLESRMEAAGLIGDNASNLTHSNNIPYVTVCRQLTHNGQWRIFE